MSTQPTRRSPAPRRRTSAAPLVAITLVAGVVAGAFGFAILRKSSPAPAAAPPAAAGAFSDLPPDRPAGKKAAPAASAPAVDPFADISSYADDPVWRKANQTADRGLALLREAAAAKEAGDPVATRAKSKEGQALLEEALRAVKGWRGDFARKLGGKDPFVQQVEETAGRWMHELLAWREAEGR
ncbi:MAG: hypothetical protein AB1726_01970 [Planctomycetota bacterium]